MSTAYQCSKCGMKDFDPGPCTNCGAETIAYQAHTPKRVEGMPNIVSDHMAKHFDWSAGCWMNSRSELKRIYAEKGLQRTSAAEFKRRHGGLEKPTAAMSYAGQSNYKSSAEKRQVV